MVDEFIHPNWHVILIHYPLGLLGIGILIELLSFLWPRSSVRSAGRWMILIGALACIPTVTSGIYAFRDVASKQVESPWYQITQSSSLSGEQWQFLRWHIILNSIGTALMAAAAVTWVAGSDGWRKRLHWPLLLVVLIGMGLLAAGAWRGGEAVYRYGTAVEGQGATGVEHPAVEPAAAPSEERAWIERYIPPAQLHLMLAGMTVALAAGALGLAIRAITAIPVREVALPEAGTGELPTEGQAMAQAMAAERMGEQPTVLVVRELIPAWRFWLLAALLGIGTALAGVWVAEMSFRDLPGLFRQVGSRMSVHLILGSSIIILSLILASLARWARRSGLLLTIFSVLLGLAIAGQIWMGILLLYDTDEGPLTHFNRPEVTAQP